MKKFIPLLLIMLSISLFAKNYDENKLRDDISAMVVKHQDKIIDQTNYDSEDLWWSTCDWVSPWSSARYYAYLTKGVTYITYTLTDGPSVKVCWKSKYEKTCKRKGNKIIFYFKPKRTGKYYYCINSVSMRKEAIGIHISYLTMLFKKGTEEEKIKKLVKFTLKD